MDDQAAENEREECVTNDGNGPEYERGKLGKKHSKRKKHAISSAENL